MKIYTISTLHDWVHFTGAAGPVGLERIFDWLTLAKVERIYWRVFEGGRATYPSQVATVFDGREVERWQGLGDGGGPKTENWALRADCKSWDPLALAVEIAHRRGIELCAWWTFCEEDHGGHVGSKFGSRADLRLHDRDGRDYPGTVEFFMPEVQRYRMQVLDELMERNVDGVLLDFARHNATPSGDAQTGIHRFGYNPAVRERFRQEHGDDPLDLPADDERWLAFKNGYRADFVRQIRQRVGDDKHLAVMTLPHVDNYRWLCVDLAGLARDGTIDLVMPFGMHYDNAPATVAAQVEALRRQVRSRRVEVSAGLQGYWGMEPDAYDAAIEAARGARAKSLVLYEADMLPRMNLITPTRAAHLKASRPQRSITVKRLKRVPTAADWKRAPEHAGFYVVAGPDRAKASAKTAFRVIAGPRALHVRVAASGKQADVPRRLIEDKQPYLDWIGARGWAGSDWAHLLVDPGPTRRDYLHLVATRDGEQLTERRFATEVDAKWSLEVEQPSRTLWVATFTLPYRTLGATPRKGDRWGFQVAREQQATNEVSSWFVSTAYGVDPAEWGDITFE